MHCVKSVQIRSFSGQYFPVFKLNTGKCGPEKTPYLDTFHAVMVIWIGSLENVFSTAQKMKFLLRISSVNVTKSAETCGFGHIY